MKIRNLQILIGGIVFFIVMSFSSGLSAQEQPAIFEIFDSYGTNKGVTLLQVSEELMKDYQIKNFRSIIFEDGTYALTDIRSSINKDKVGAKMIKESIQDGLLTSGYYRLKTDDEKMNRYLIFKIGKNNKVTLIYIEGFLTPEQLVDLLK